MAFPRFFLISIFIFSSEFKKSENNHPDSYLNITEIIVKYGYPAETHEITTRDGYIINIFRICHGKGASGINKKPILLLHGIFGQAENFVISGMYNASLAYHLADNGFDVWLGNTRGNKHGRRHISLNPKYRSFWNFSWHEIGMNDLPESIDYILEKRKMEKLYYIGHSQGGTSFYIMASLKPEYQKKIILASLLAPAGYMTHFNNRVLMPLFRDVQRAQSFFNKYHEFPPYSSMIFRALLSTFCNEATFQDICSLIYNVIVGYDSKEVPKEILAVAVEHVPTVSSRQIMHFVQSAKSGHFRRWDYGRENNLKRYGTAEPPDYPIKSIKVPIAVYYSLGDTIVDHKDIVKTSAELPNCVRKYLISNPLFTHIDFLFASDQNLMIYPVLEFLKRYDDESQNYL